MTPSRTFQWPLSPVGGTQPERSLPLKSETKPGARPAGDGALAAEAAEVESERRAEAASRSAAIWGFIVAGRRRDRRRVVDGAACAKRQAGCGVHHAIPWADRG